MAHALQAKSAETGNRQHQAWALRFLAVCDLRQGKPPDAVWRLEQALDRLGETAALNERISIIGSLALAKSHVGDVTAARETALEGLALINNAARPAGHATLEAYSALSQVALDAWHASPWSSDWQKAARRCVRALRRYRAVFPIGEARYRLWQGRYRQMALRNRAAQSSFQRGASAARLRGMGWDEAQCIEALTMTRSWIARQMLTSPDRTSDAKAHMVASDRSLHYSFTARWTKRGRCIKGVRFVLNLAAFTGAQRHLQGAHQIPERISSSAIVDPYHRFHEYQPQMLNNSSRPPRRPSAAASGIRANRPRCRTAYIECMKVARSTVYHLNFAARSLTVDLYAENTSAPRWNRATGSAIADVSVVANGREQSGQSLASCCLPQGFLSIARAGTRYRLRHGSRTHPSRAAGRGGSFRKGRNCAPHARTSARRRDTNCRWIEMAMATSRVAPIFRQERIRDFLPAMIAGAERTRDRWRALSPGAEIDVAHEMMRTTFDIILNTMLPGRGSVDVELMERAITRYLELTSWIVALSMIGAPRWVPYPGVYRARHARKQLHLFSESLILEAAPSPHERNDLLSLLTTETDPETGKSMNATDVRNNLLTFIIAGHETTALALTWTFYLLSVHPEVEQQVKREIAAAIGCGPVHAKHIEALAYTNQVIQEAMRLYPPAALIVRAARRNVELANEEICAGTTVYVPVYAIHRHEKLWCEPDRFDPSRFEPKVAKARDRYSYLPFGAGPRICIGQNFALTEATAVLATLLNSFQLRLRSGHDPEPRLRVTLRPAGGMPMRIYG